MSATSAAAIADGGARSRRRIGGKTYELAGPEVLTMRELNAADRARWPGSRPDLVDVPDFVAGGIASSASCPARR